MIIYSIFFYLFQNKLDIRSVVNSVVNSVMRKPFSCRVCFQTFTRQDNLRSHLTRHTEAEIEQANVRAQLLMARTGASPVPELPDRAATPDQDGNER